MMQELTREEIMVTVAKIREIRENGEMEEQTAKQLIGCANLLLQQLPTD